jgi:hypothetical protein
LTMLYEGFVCRMPDSDAEAMGVPPLIPHRVPAYKLENGWLNCHYVRGYVTRAVAAGDHQLSPRELAAMDVFASLGNHPDVLIEMLLEPGDFQIFNNRTVLHGRAHSRTIPRRSAGAISSGCGCRSMTGPRFPASKACSTVKTCGSGKSTRASA